jgi:hypothetical protein
MNTMNHGTSMVYVHQWCTFEKAKEAVREKWDHSWDHRSFLTLSEMLVGAPRFELGTPCTPFKKTTNYKSLTVQAKRTHAPLIAVF